ncbi:MAG: cytochrome c [Fimbriimonadaceae bacterium]|nr:cytochrome c [Fimbriimonadaceae bacterium]
MKRSATFLMLAGLAVLAGGCHLDMWVQSKVKPQSESKVFADGLGSRLEPAGSIAFGDAKLDTPYYTGYTRQGTLVKEFPVKVDEAFIKRGRERYMIFCAPCHGASGNGQGMIAQRGFTVSRPIPSYHTDRLKEMPIGHFFDVVSNGYGSMYPFASRIKPDDRWAISAYIRVLQKSQDPNFNFNMTAAPAEPAPVEVPAP